MGKIDLSNTTLDYAYTNNITNDVCLLINTAQKAAFKSVDLLLVQRNWLIGCRIAEEEIKDSTRSQLYGKEIIKELSKSLTEIYGKGFTKTNLYNFYQFYEMFPDFFHTPCGKSFSKFLTWSHYRVLLQVKDSNARLWYAQASFDETWSVRTLQRNVSSQYYYRMLQSPKPEAVRNEMKSLTENYQNNKLEFIKNPVIAEFLGFARK